MPPSTPLKAKPDEKDIELLDYSGAINQLNVIAKRELEDTKNQISLANYDLARLRDQKVREASDLETWKRAEKLKFTNDITQRQNDIIAKQNQINNEVLQQERILADLHTQQAKFETLNQERLEIKEQLVKLEGRKIEVEDAAKQVETLRSSALSAQNQGNIALAKASEDTEKTRQENIRLVALNDSLTKRENKVVEDEKSLKELKDFVEPKLRSIKDEADALEKAKIEQTERLNMLAQTIQDEKIMLQSVQEKRAKLDRDMVAFLSQKDEFTRQQTLAGK